MSDGMAQEKTEVEIAAQYWQVKPRDVWQLTTSIDGETRVFLLQIVGESFSDSIRTPLGPQAMRWEADLEAKENDKRFLGSVIQISDLSTSVFLSLEPETRVRWSDIYTNAQSNTETRVIVCVWHGDKGPLGLPPRNFDRLVGGSVITTIGQIRNGQTSRVRDTCTMEKVSTK
jgi:tRNA G37 N-methylase Trm5